MRFYKSEPSKLSSIILLAAPNAKPPNEVFASTRWQGITIGTGFLCSALPTAWCAPDNPIDFASSPYEEVVPNGIFAVSSKTFFVKGDMSISIGMSNIFRRPLK